MIHLARHGQTAYNAEGRFQGHLPVPLNDTGFGQAEELAQAASGVEIVSLWCSPLLRAVQTAEAVARRIGLRPTTDERFAETDTGDWTGRSFAEIRAEDPEGFRRFEVSDPDFRLPRRRVVRRAERARRRRARRPAPPA